MIQMIFLVLGRFLTAAFVLLFYQKLLHSKLAIGKLITILFLNTLLVNLTADIIISPFGRLIGLVLIGFFIRIFQKKLSLTALILSFFVAQFIWPITAVLVGTITFMLLRIEAKNLSTILVLFLEVLIYIVLLKNKKIDKLQPLMWIKEIERLSLLLTCTLLIIFSFVHALFNGLDHLFDPIIIFFLFGMATLVAVTLIFSLGNEFKKYREKSRLEKQIDHQSQTIDNLTSLTHSFKNGVRLITFLLLELNLHITQDGQVADSGNIFKLNDLLANFENLVLHLGTDLAYKEMARHVHSLNIPNEWWEVKLTLASFLEQAFEQKVFLEVKNHLADWNELEISGIELSGLVENLVSNAFKELAKTDIDGKLVIVHFYKNEAGYIAFAVTDNAHEFPLDILLKLGQRKNSTNGTGDGYAEVFDILAEIGASFLIEEKFVLDQIHKKITVTLDGASGYEIKSDYR